jgi:hypothetical protein
VEWQRKTTIHNMLPMVVDIPGHELLPQPQQQPPIMMMMMTMMTMIIRRPSHHRGLGDAAMDILHVEWTMMRLHLRPLLPRNHHPETCRSHNDNDNDNYNVDCHEHKSPVRMKVTMRLRALRQQYHVGLSCLEIVLVLLLLLVVVAVEDLLLLLVCYRCRRRHSMLPAMHNDPAKNYVIQVWQVVVASQRRLGNRRTRVRVVAMMTTTTTMTMMRQNSQQDLQPCLRRTTRSKSCIVHRPK